MGNEENTGASSDRDLIEEWRERALRWQGELIAARNEVESLKAENFKLAAGQCIVDGGLLGDEYGHQYCSLIVPTVTVEP